MVAPLRVGDFMETGLHCVPADEEIMSAVDRLVALNISGLLVVDEQRSLLGILTERDCIEVALQAGYFDEGGGRVADYMTSDVLTVEASASLMDVAEKFARGPYRRYPVLDGGHLVGIIARRDVLSALTSGAWFTAPSTERYKRK